MWTKILNIKRNVYSSEYTILRYELVLLHKALQTICRSHQRISIHEVSERLFYLTGIRFQKAECSILDFIEEYLLGVEQKQQYFVY